MNLPIILFCDQKRFSVSCSQKETKISFYVEIGVISA